MSSQSLPPLQDESFPELEPEFGPLSNSQDKPAKQASLVIELMKDAEFFHDKQNRTYVTISNNGHKENWRLDSEEFKSWLSRQYWQMYGKPLSASVIQDALAVLDGMARFNGECKEVYIRVAAQDGNIYIDLANEYWQVIEVSTNGTWMVSSSSPVKFVRNNNMRPLPDPVRGGNIEILWSYINIPEKYQKLVLAFILECYRFNTPFIILVLYGMQGSAKSTTQIIIRNFIDPSANNLRTAPKKSEDLLVAAANNWLVSFNNVSHLSDTQQDELCSVATGGAFATRIFYTENRETVVDVKRPVVINGISDLVTAQDLIDRCISLELPEISPQNRTSEEELLHSFNKDYANILGALLDILAKVLLELPNVKLTCKPRMADFAVLGVALENVMGWADGSFMADYISSQNDGMANALEHSPVAVALISMIDTEYSYEGSYRKLYDRLIERYKATNVTNFPRSPRGLANQIKRQKVALRTVGIEVITSDRRQNDGYHVFIKKIEEEVHNVH